MIRQIIETEKINGIPNNMVIDYEIAPDVQLVTDQYLLMLVVENLIDNAIKYRKRHGNIKPFIHIKLTASTDGEIKFVISDNGIGIRTDKVAKVFDMFLRATETSKGTGLGLYIVKTSVQKLQGSIEVNSIEGKGSTFTLILPSLAEIKQENQ